MINGVRVLVANEPRAYRDAHGGMLGEIYPGADIRMTTASDLAATYDEFAPHLVICSSLLPEPVKNDAFAWVLLYPDDADLAVVCVADEQRVIEGVAIQHLMEVVEEVARHVASMDDAGAGGNADWIPPDDVEHGLRHVS